MLKNSLPEQFDANELLLRAVPRIPNFWKDNNHPSSAAFKQSNGTSVDRTYDRSLDASIAFIQKNQAGKDVVTVTLDICQTVNAIVRYIPIPENIFHCEIHGSKDRIMLAKPQAKELALHANLVYRATITIT